MSENGKTAVCTARALIFLKAATNLKASGKTIKSKAGAPIILKIAINGKGPMWIIRNMAGVCIPGQPANQKKSCGRMVN